MIDSIIIIISHAKGAFIGAATGAIHETFIVIRKKSRVASFWNFFLAILVSSFVGWVAFDILGEMKVSRPYKILWTIIFSLNSYLVFQILTDPAFILGIIKIYAPRISERDAEKIKLSISKKKDE